MRFSAISPEGANTALAIRVDLQQTVRSKRFPDISQVLPSPNVHGCYA